MSNPSVLVLGNLLDEAAEILKVSASFLEHPRENAVAEAKLIELLKDRDAVISEPLDHFSETLLDRCPKLKIIANRAVGFDNIDLEQASARGILVTNTPGVLDAATADLAMALTLAVARRIVEADRYVRDGKWQGFQSDLMLGPDLYGKTLGVIGMGRIGRAFAERARAFGLKVIYCRFSARDEKDDQLKQILEAERVDLETLLEDSDFISLHCPYNADTHHLIGARELSRMKPQAVLVNTARGRIIDETALVKHLEAGNIFGAGLDVFENEPALPDRLKKLENVVLTPHIGSACFDTRRRMTMLAVESIKAAFQGDLPKHLLNPEAWEKFKERTACPNPNPNPNPNRSR